MYAAERIESIFLQNMPFGHIDYFIPLKAFEKQWTEEGNSDLPFHFQKLGLCSGKSLLSTRKKKRHS